MSRIRSIVFTAVLVAIPLGVVVATGAQATAQPDRERRYDYPPPDHIAANQPEYYEGRPVYYYHNLWYFRDHGRWRYYRNEPAPLRERRGHWDRDRVRYRYHR